MAEREGHHPIFDGPRKSLGGLPTRAEAMGAVAAADTTQTTITSITPKGHATPPGALITKP